MEAQSKLVPELMDILQERFRILKYVEMAGPIGRRSLGEMAGLSERETRTMIDLLRTQQLINVAKNGATVTLDGLKVLEELEPLMERWTGRATLKRRLQELLGISSIKIVAGDCDEHHTAKDLLGMKAANEFISRIDSNKTIAVTGGSTVASIPNFIQRTNELKDLLFIAARGGVGEEIGLQANVIAASFSEVCGGKYSAFYYPDSLSEEAHKAFLNEPSVQKMIQLYDEVDCVIHGIGDAQVMATLRNSTEEVKETIVGADAKGEAFGYYFDRTGKVVHRIRTVGVQISQLERVPLLIAVAGGKSKAQAILSYMAIAPKQTTLITDEGAAHEMLKLLNQ